MFNRAHSFVIHFKFDIILLGSCRIIVIILCLLSNSLIYISVIFSQDTNHTLPKLELSIIHLLSIIRAGLSSHSFL